jgi:hypothetical protein
LPGIAAPKNEPIDFNVLENEAWNAYIKKLTAKPECEKLVLEYNVEDTHALADVVLNRGITSYRGQVTPAVNVKRVWFMVKREPSFHDWLASMGFDFNYEVVISFLFSENFAEFLLFFGIFGIIAIVLYTIISETI